MLLWCLCWSRNGTDGKESLTRLVAPLALRLDSPAYRVLQQRYSRPLQSSPILALKKSRGAELESEGTSTNRLFAMPVCTGDVSNKPSFDLLTGYSEQPDVSHPFKNISPFLLAEQVVWCLLSWSFQGAGTGCPCARKQEPLFLLKLYL